MREEKRGNLQMILLGIIIIVAIVYMVFIKPYYYQFNGGEIQFEPIFVEDFSDNSEYEMYVYDGEIYLSSTNGFKKIASDGEHLWDQSYYLPGAYLITSDSYMCVCDINGKDAYLFNKEGLVTSVNTNYEILLADVNEVGAMSFLMDTGSSYRIEIYNRLGNLAAERDIIVKQDGYPICYDLAPNGEILVVNQMIVEGESVHSNLQFFSFGDEGRKDPNHIIGSEMVSDVWIGELVFIDETSIMAIADQAIYFYDVSDVPTLTAVYDYDQDIHHYGITEDAVVVTFTDTISKKETIVLFEEKGKVISETMTESELIGFDYNKKNYYMIYDYQIEKYDGEKRIWFAENPRGAVLIANLYREYYVIGYDNSYEIVKMKEL